MSQVTIYLPDDLAGSLRKEARRAGKSLSAYIADLARRKPKKTGWPAGFGRLYGACRGDLPEIEDAPPDEIPGE